MSQRQRHVWGGGCQTGRCHSAGELGARAWQQRRCELWIYLTAATASGWLGEQSPAGWLPKLNADLSVLLIETGSSEAACIGHCPVRSVVLHR